MGTNGLCGRSQRRGKRIGKTCKVAPGSASSRGFVLKPQPGKNSKGLQKTLKMRTVCELSFYH